MTSAANKGRTILEYLHDRWFGSPEPAPVPKSEIRVSSPSVDFYNPLGLRVGGNLKIGTAEFKDYEFQLTQISEYTRVIGKKILKFADYSLLDPSVGEKGLYLTVRVMPQGDGVQYTLYRPYQEYPFSDRMVAKFDGTEFAAEGNTEPAEPRFTDPETEVSYERCGSNEATVRELTSDGIKRRSMKYWDFINDEEKVRRLYLAEMDLSDEEGETQVFLGTPLSKYDVKPTSGHIA